jgi:hypothetical protein
LQNDHIFAQMKNYKRMPLNTIKLEEALKEIHVETGDGDLTRLTKFYEVESFEEIAKRCASVETSNGKKVKKPEELARRCTSIITRGESQIFTASMPRFAIRLYMPEQLGFINCRRIGALLEQERLEEAGEWGKKPNLVPSGMMLNPDLERDLDPKRVRDIVIDDNRIADSLLAPPTGVQKMGFEFISIKKWKLPEAYCESDTVLSAEKDYLPFAKTFDIGGGLCSQVVSFIATAILAHHSQLVCSIPEITALAHNPKYIDLSLSGLTPQMMNAYFEQVNLRLTEQFAAHEAPTHDLNGPTREIVATALLAYLKSGFPVVLPVDQYQMAFGTNSGQSSIYTHNGLEVRTSGQPFNAPHAVIAVGWGHHEGQPTFVFHDPAGMPYMVMTRDEFCQVGAIYPDTSNPDNGVIMPITPNDVVVPLLCERHYVGEYKAPVRQTSGGMYPLAHTFHKNCSFSKWPIPPGITLGEFRLCRATDLGSIPNIVENALLRAQAESVLHGYIRDLCQNNALDDDHWFWVEFFPESIWIWNAEDALPDQFPTGGGMEMVEQLFNTATRFLMGVICLKTEGAEMFPVVQQSGQ